MEPQQNSKKTVWLIVSGIVLVIVAIAVYVSMGLKTPAGTESVGGETSPENISTDVQQGLDSLNLGDLNSEMDSLNTDINKL